MILRKNLEVLPARTKTIKTRNFEQPSVIIAYKTMESGVRYIEGVYDNVGWQKLPKTLHVFKDNGKIRKKSKTIKECFKFRNAHNCLIQPWIGAEC